MNRRRNYIVARLPAIHVIVRMRARQVSNHLVGVHVGGRSAAGLEYVDNKLRVVIARSHGVGGLLNGCGQIRRQLAQPPIHSRSRALNQPQRTNEGSRKTQAADRKIFNRPLRLGAIQRIGWDAHLAHRVVLDTVFHAALVARPNHLEAATTAYRRGVRTPACRLDTRVETMKCHWAQVPAIPALRPAPARAKASPATAH